eukprot:scaffold45584_cov39-Attheya_sp.AAC.2
MEQPAGSSSCRIILAPRPSRPIAALDDLDWASRSSLARRCWALVRIIVSVLLLLLIGSCSSRGDEKGWGERQPGASGSLLGAKKRVSTLDHKCVKEFMSDPCWGRSCVSVCVL